MRAAFIACAAFLSLILARPSPAQTPGAVLHCDPAVVLKAVDDDVIDPKASATPFCEVPLAAGDHWLDVCYDASRASSAGTYLVQRIAVCDKDKVVNFKAEPGRVYRLKLDLVSPQWKTWIEDVTDTESNLPPGTRGSRPAHKGEGKVTLVLHMTPANGRVGVANGSTHGVWFYEGMFGQMPMKGDGESGFITKKAAGGDTVGITVGWMPRGKTVLNSAAAVACGDTKIPVYEDIPGGGALYLGDFVYTQTGKGVALKVSQDGLEAARAWLAKSDPKLAGRLTPVSPRWLRTPTICLDVSTDSRLVNAGS